MEILSKRAKVTAKPEKDAIAERAEEPEKN